MKNKDQQKLSVFVDESGSFLYPDNDSCFYVIGMVFHDQSIDIRQQLTDMDRSIDEIGLDPETFVFHAGPLIRRAKFFGGPKAFKHNILRRIKAKEIQP